ncbi:regulator of chromosome condensation 1/beta-lactamase-inhibitor protein II [Delphinella strobiligena]|nr:regulator of chromosome condensation 1/beta-lactamase-inhibitor protein II [Delphinella strobiligena]
MASDTPKTKLLDLPVDIFYLLFPYLDVPDFVALTSTCAALHQPDISQYARYWSTATRSTFRVPNQPVVENDGVRWQKMYKRLLTQSKVYSWGNNEMGCLGHSVLTNEQLNAVPPASRRRLAMRSRHVSWPTEMLNTDSISVIADMQCGGWSTNLLTSKGALYSVGVLDGLHVMHNRGIFTQRSHPVPTKLRYPPGFLHPSERYDTATAVRQFSAGRAHILAVSDSGRIWSWQNVDHAAYNVKFLNIELKEQAKNDEVGYVDKVVAGWDKSCALVNGAGIVLWDVLKRDLGSEESEEDAALVLETATVPMTAYRQPRVNARSSYTQDGEHVGEVLNFICLEKYVLFNTHLGKVFASSITWDNQVQTLSIPVEIVIPSEDGYSVNEERFAADVQGSFRSFAIFTRDGAVLIGHQDMLHDLANRDGPLVALKRFPALQNTGVISLAFGDYHFHALHASGHITSYGNEPQACGALGLGGHGDPEGRLRGLRYQGIAGDARLVPHAYSTGRRVWFECEKQAWITFLTSGGADPEEARERLQMCHETNVHAEVSEWVEQEGRAWEDRFGGEHDLDDDGLGAYFALNVTAAGWHSGALVLVNEELAKNGRPYAWANDPFPRLRLSDGREMPGQIEISEWRFGRPEWDLSVVI